MQKTFLATIVATLIGLFGTQAMACGNKACQGSCQQHSQEQKGQCGCSGGSCKGK